MNETPNAAVKLFSPEYVGIATFLGSPIAGCILLALNYRALGQNSMARQTMIWGGVITVVVMTLGYVLPKSLAYGVAMGGVLGMYAGAKKAPGMDYGSYVANGGVQASGWVAAGIGLGCMCVILVILFIVVLITGGVGK